MGLALNDKDREIFQLCLNSIVTTEKQNLPFTPGASPAMQIAKPVPMGLLPIIQKE